MRETEEEAVKAENKKENFVEGVDFYFENGFMVLTAHFLKKRGYCCDSGCRHCPYQEDETAVSK